MVKVWCDLCGRVIDPYEDKSKFRLRKMTKDDYQKKPQSDLDICEDCDKKIRDFLANEYPGYDKKYKEDAFYADD